MRKTFVGPRLRALRGEHGLRQADLAQRLGISPSYLNQLEHNQRPLTVPVLTRLNAAFDVDVSFLGEDDQLRLVSELRDVLATDGLDGITTPDLDELAATLPAVGRALVTLHRRHRTAVEQIEALTAGLGGGRGAEEAPGPSRPWPLMPYEEVRDFVFAHRNHFPTLDAPAERLARDRGLTPGDMAHDLVTLLRDEHGVRVEVHATGDGALGDDEHRRFDPERRVLSLDRRLRPGQRAFHLATQLALLRLRDEIDALVDAHAFTVAEARSLARIALAGYVAGALLMPYGAFLTAAEELHYDVDLLGERFGVGFEKVCHRLSSLQRPGAQGVPFLFVRVDRAGNISKRQSATDFQFSRVGGGCPLWVVHDAFTTPDRIVTQVAEMPDGRRYLWVARTVTDRRGAWGRPTKSFALALGCDVRHADRLVYARGLDLGDTAAAVPIGPGCRACPRPDCPQRAFPAVGQSLGVDEHRSRFAAYTPADPEPA